MMSENVFPSSHSRSRRRCILPWMTAFLAVVASIPFCDASSAQAASAEAQQAESCGEPDACFSSAAWPKERLGNALTRDQVIALKLERLRQVMERFPGSLWAKRAGLLSGVLSIEQNPTGALARLREAQPEFPILDDYIRFWIGEALLHLGEAKEAAMVFEGVARTVPDSNLIPLLTLRAGESWYQASSCLEAVFWLTKAVGLNDKDPNIAQAWLQLADCHFRINQTTEGKETLRKLWVKFPQSKEAREAESLLAGNNGGEPWVPQADDVYARAQVLLGQSLHAEAVEELKKFLGKDPVPSLRSEAKFKLGVALVRLKRYDQARDTFQELVGEQTSNANDAAVWLARVYLRQGLGEKLLEFSRGVSKRPLAAEQRGQIDLFTGIWLEDQAQFDEAIAKYRQVAKSGEPASQRTEARWREGWVLYRTGRHQEAINVWQAIVDQRDSEWEPQALYWIARSYGRAGNLKAREIFHLLCKRYPYTYYCQLAQRQLDNSASIPPEQEQGQEHAAASTPVDPPPSLPLQDASRAEIEQQPAYRRAIELRALGLEQDAARELTALTDYYSRAPDALTTLSVMLNEVGAYHHALRLVRARFRDRLERTGGAVADGLWSVAYPTGLIPTIKTQKVNGVDPFLIAAIIREESQYDWRAVSRVGAIGLMQIMPHTASAVAQRHRLPGVVREDLFDQETNIQIGVRYVEQLLAQFSGNVVQAIAAYNAGPIAVESWATVFRGRSEDEFVELIPFQETRQYVKRVLRSYQEYVRLAGLAKPVS